MDCAVGGSPAIEAAAEIFNGSWVQQRTGASASTTTQMTDNGGCGPRLLRSTCRAEVG
ncbi:hypothetical protein SAMN05216377_1151, partial [Pseudonocardia oroxyli]